MTIQERKNALNALYQMGYKHGVHDYDHDNKSIIEDEKFGSFYVDGYNTGFSDANTRKWYIVALDRERHQIQSWYVERESADKPNSWSQTQEGATAFKTEEAAHASFPKNLGRGEYKIIWR